jgi:hypothetical protein
VREREEREREGRKEDEKLIRGFISREIEI